TRRNGWARLLQGGAQLLWQVAQGGQLGGLATSQRRLCLRFALGGDAGRPGRVASGLGCGKVAAWPSL
ncbi:MAG: hypothetical protein ACRCWE_06230, partial [Stenotrophomonas maltophilia]